MRMYIIEILIPFLCQFVSHNNKKAEMKSQKLWNDKIENKRKKNQFLSGAIERNEQTANLNRIALKGFYCDVEVAVAEKGSKRYLKSGRQIRFPRGISTKLGSQRKTLMCWIKLSRRKFFQGSLLPSLEWNNDRCKRLWYVNIVLPRFSNNLSSK